MTVKFRIGLTITGETLFGLLSKMLPIEDLSVEEIGPSAAVAKRLAAEPKRIGKRQRPNRGPDLKRGINGIIVMALKDGPKREVDIAVKVKAASYSPNSTSSRLEALRRFSVIERSDDGTWKLKDA